METLSLRRYSGADDIITRGCRQPLFRSSLRGYPSVKTGLVTYPQPPTLVRAKHRSLSSKTTAGHAEHMMLPPPQLHAGFSQAINNIAELMRASDHKAACRAT